MPYFLKKSITLPHSIAVSSSSFPASFSPDLKNFLTLSKSKDSSMFSSSFAVWLAFVSSFFSLLKKLFTLPKSMDISSSSFFSATEISSSFFSSFLSLLKNFFILPKSIDISSSSFESISCDHLHQGKERVLKSFCEAVACEVLDVRERVQTHTQVPRSPSHNHF